MAKAIVRKKTAPIRRPWSKDDVRVLKSMARKEPVAKIAKALKRNRRSDASKGYRDRLVAQTRAKEASIRKEGLRQKQVAEPPTTLSLER